MKRLALAAMLFGAVCVASFALRAEDAPEPTLYVQVRFESCLNGDADAEALAAWNSFVVEAKKIQGFVDAFRPRPHKTENDDVLGTLNQPRLTVAQITALAVEAGKLINSPCFNRPQLSIKLSSATMEIKPLVPPKTSIPRPRD